MSKKLEPVDCGCGSKAKCQAVYSLWSYTPTGNYQVDMPVRRAVVCTNKKCQTTGPRRYTDHGAIRSWNKAMGGKPEWMRKAAKIDEERRKKRREEGKGGNAIQKACAAARRDLAPAKEAIRTAHTTPAPKVRKRRK